MSSSGQEHPQLYLHSNDSSLSTIQFQKIPTQVSSVGFNTLKKQITSSSLNLSITTSNSIKLNTISKLLSRNKSSLTVHEDSIRPQVFDEESRPSIEDDHSNVSQKGSGLFKMSRAKLKFSNKGVTRPDLTIQTAGHHTLKVPKKILSSATSDEFSNKKAVSSPISRSLFHRQHNQLDSNKSGGEDAKARHQKYHRTAMNLSSQSSNSFISDVKVAVLYNFTDPDYSIDDDDETSDNLIILDFRKMYMTSADQYASSSRFNKSDNAVLEDLDANDQTMQNLMESQDCDFEKTLAMLFDLLKPLFQPSKQTMLRDGLLLPSMTLTMEQVKNVVGEKIISSARSFLSSKYPTKFTRRMSEDGSSKEARDNVSMNGNLDEDIQDLRRKELGLQLSYYFEKCCTLLVDDIRNFDDLCTLEDIISGSRGKCLQDLKSADQISKDETRQYNYLREWRRIVLVWRYFNLKVRFFILNAFYQLQKHFNDEERFHINSGQKSWNVRIENALLIAFRDSVIIPHLLRRPTDLEHGSISYHDPVANEIHFFRNEGVSLVKTLRHCFGAILSHLQSELVGSDDQPFKEMMFDEYVHWFCQMTR